MIIFVSDMHFGRGDLATEHAEEHALLSCLRAFEEEIDHLFLLGDVFDQYIEYRHLVPKGLARLQGMLATWTDKGIPVTYLTGNHDPWHIDYFERELGVRVKDGPLKEPLLNSYVYMHHGDLVGSRIPLYKALKSALRHPIPVFLYRAMLPGDMGFKLARWVRGMLHSEEIDQRVVKEQRIFARHVLSTEQCNLVVMGHSHYPERMDTPDGTYINTGSWRFDRTFVCMTAQQISLMRWDGEIAHTWKEPPDASAMTDAPGHVFKAS